MEKASADPSKYTEMRDELQATAGGFGRSETDLLQGIAHYTKAFDRSARLKAKVTSRPRANSCWPRCRG